MHARRRSPGGPNSLGLEKGYRNRRMYNADYRGFDTRLGRGLPKPYPPRPRREDIFMEAGRLAAEYLVSQGVLPASSLPEKWPNGSFQEFSGHDRENLQEGGRTSALARLGNVVPDGGSWKDKQFSGKRRFGDEFRVRGRRKVDYGRGYGSDWNRENGRAGPWFEKVRSTVEIMESEDDLGGGHHQGEKRVRSDVVGRGVSKVVDEQLPSKSETSESDIDNFEFPNDTGSRKDQVGLDVDLNQGFDPEGLMSEVNELGELKDVVCGEEVEMKDLSEDFSTSGVQSVGNDSISLCGIENVPMGMRPMGSKIDQGLGDQSPPVLEEKNGTDVPEKGSKISLEEESLGGSPSDSQMNQNLNSSVVASEISIVSPAGSMGEAGEVDINGMTFDIQRERCKGSEFFSGRSSFSNQHESSGCLPRFGDGELGSRTYVRRRGAVRLKDQDYLMMNVGMGEGSKRPRDWDSCTISQVDEYFWLNDLRVHQPGSQVEKLCPGMRMGEAVEKERLADGMDTKSMFVPQVSSDDLEFREERQFFPNLFQTCDVDLPDTSKRTENFDDLVLRPISSQFSTPEVEREAAISVGLLIGLGCFNNANGEALDDFPDGSAVDTRVSCRDFQVLIDRFPLLKKLYQSREITTRLNCLVCLGSKRMTETTYLSVESLLNHTNNSHDLTEVHKCYGLAISQLLGADLSKFSSEAPDFDDPLNEIPLMHDEGMLGEDDSIYVSLEEIPVNMPEI